MGPSQNDCVGPSSGEPAGDPLSQQEAQKLGDIEAALGFRYISGQVLVHSGGQDVAQWRKLNTAQDGQAVFWPCSPMGMGDPILVVLALSSTQSRGCLRESCCCHCSSLQLYSSFPNHLCVPNAPFKAPEQQISAPKMHLLFLLNAVKIRAKE